MSPQFFPHSLESFVKYWQGLYSAAAWHAEDKEIERVISGEGTAGFFIFDCAWASTFGVATAFKLVPPP
jgi:hypothetical protein